MGEYNSNRIHGFQGRRTMKKIVMVMMVVLCFVVLLASSSNATLVEVSVETDKDVYELGEDILIDVTAYNPGSGDETLTFTDSIHASYEIDSVYNWADGIVSQPYGSILVLQPGTSETWTFTHTFQHYALEAGPHSIIGQVGALELIGGGSEAASITVIPEPASILSFGSVFIVLKKSTSLKRKGF